jgi:hypothetical protein
MKAVWLDLPGKDMSFSNKERLKIQPRRFTGIIDVFHETTAKTYGTDNKETFFPVMRKVAEIAPTGRVFDEDLADLLTKYFSFSGHKGKARFTAGSETIDLEACLSPYAIAGVMQLPSWLLVSVDVRVYINETLILHHKF